MTPLLAEEGPPRMFYRITMGVRPGEDSWKRQLNSMIRDLQPQIDAILADYGVPLLDDEGTALKVLPPR
jgi:polar amino acid transport system substrate-binding protein